mgnify:FL=1|jgi:Fur family iron response transcriptional regulator|tara:strand:+ start:589 stop:1014 length:426 start_codon:yes stop_codon:yes gene_type:complete
MPIQEAKYIGKLRSSGLRPTKQRINICEVLFDRDKTFHFSINDLKKILHSQFNQKISLATIYNTVHAFKKKGYLKEINIGNDISYFDTNTSSHHHFYDEHTKELIDINSQEVEIKKTPTPPNGKKIKGIEITFKISKKSSL